MAFEESTKEQLNQYIRNHLPNDEWFTRYFNFIKDVDLSTRLADEFKSARYIYKLLEGLQATDWLLVCQVRVQIIQYASIYEAVVHYLLFDVMKESIEVKKLMLQEAYKRISVRKDLDNLEHSGHKIYTMYKTQISRDLTKIRFDEKVKLVEQLGFISQSLADDLTEIYGYRNAIHIHAELRKSFEYELELSAKAYRRMQPFREQILKKLTSDNLYSMGSHVE